MSFLASVGTGWVSGKVWLWTVGITCLGVALTLPRWVLYPTFVALPLLFLWSLSRAGQAAGDIQREGGGTLETFDLQLEVALRVPIFLIVFWGGSGIVALFFSRTVVYVWWGLVILYFAFKFMEFLSSEEDAKEAAKAAAAAKTAEESR